MQEEPSDNPREFAFWTDIFAKGDPEEVRELVISCVLTNETLYDCMSLMRQWISGEELQLKRLSELPKSRFQRKDEFIPNPLDPEDGVTIKADPKKWLENTIKLATAKLTVKSTISELSLKLSNPKEFDDGDFGSHTARTLDVTVHGKAAAKAGTIEFGYADRTIKLEVKKGEGLDSVLNRRESMLLRKEGSLSVDGFYDSKKSGKQTVKFEVL